MTDGISAWAILAITLAVLGFGYIAMDIWRSAKRAKDGGREERKRYYQQNLSFVKINEHDYVDTRRITGYSVFHTAAPCNRHLYVILDGDPVTNRYWVNDICLGNVIDYLYRVLDMEVEDYGDLDNWYDRAVDYARPNKDNMEGETI